MQKPQCQNTFETTIKYFRGSSALSPRSLINNTASGVSHGKVSTSVVGKVGEDLSTTAVEVWKGAHGVLASGTGKEARPHRRTPQSWREKRRPQEHLLGENQAPPALDKLKGRTQDPHISRKPRLSAVEAGVLEARPPELPNQAPPGRALESPGPGASSGRPPAAIPRFASRPPAPPRPPPGHIVRVGRGRTGAPRGGRGARLGEPRWPRRSPAPSVGSRPQPAWKLREFPACSRPLSRVPSLRLGDPRSRVPLGWAAGTAVQDDAPPGRTLLVNNVALCIKRLKIVIRFIRRFPLS
ncbi:formin-like protein 5 [Nannospalax galili]|uniref:formin-like protein 5 n=1 Tax=Nannospalax galili TaxID=1026970 RepID=UPI00111C72DC|nr:formin-like protein 5 [Nannospalax galili]